MHLGRDSHATVTTLVESIMRLLFPLVLAFGLCQLLLGQETQNPAAKDGVAPIEVLVLASYHLSNPGKDTVNIHVDDVLEPKRQQELEALAKRLELFKPTKVAVEKESAAQGFIWKVPLDSNDLKVKPDEVFQIGERVALGSGLDKLYGVDSDGNFDAGPVKALDDRKTNGKRMQTMIKDIQGFADEADHKLYTLTIGQATAWMNSPEAIRRNNSFYMESLKIADGEDQPAAKLDAQWYERNLRIWGKVLQIAQPGDRILLIFGQGHAFWLRNLVQEMPGYKLVDPTPYLDAALPGVLNHLPAK